MNKKTKKVIFAIYIITLFAIITSASFAYFTYLQVSNVSPRVEATTATITDWLMFDVGKPITIYANDENFAQGMPSISDATPASATLQVTSSDNTSKTYFYNIILDINRNDFVYSTSNETPELLIKVTDPDGNEVREIQGLEYVESNGYTGFDITTASGHFNLASHQEITTSTQVTQNWQIEIIFINLSTNQDVNMDKSFSGEIRMVSVNA